jgi:hypothetical protein
LSFEERKNKNLELHLKLEFLIHQKKTLNFLWSLNFEERKNKSLEL